MWKLSSRLLKYVKYYPLLKTAGHFGKVFRYKLKYPFRLSIFESCLVFIAKFVRLLQDTLYASGGESRAKNKVG
jgi:hypothetical protein